MDAGTAAATAAAVVLAAVLCRPRTAAALRRSAGPRAPTILAVPTLASRRNANALPVLAKIMAVRPFRRSLSREGPPDPDLNVEEHDRCR